MKRLLRHLAGWPANPSGRWPKRSAMASPAEAIMFEVQPAQGNIITFLAVADGIKHSFRLEAANSLIAEKVTALLDQMIGYTLLELGDIVVDA